MSRLTYLNESRETTELTQFEGDSWEELIKNADTVDQVFMHNAIDKLYEYEELEEQGLLLKLPFDVNSEVFIVSKQFILERNCMKYEVKKLKVRDFNYNFLHNFTIVCEERIGDSICQRHLFNTDKIFLTKEEAEQELKRMESAE